MAHCLSRTCFRQIYIAAALLLAVATAGAQAQSQDTEQEIRQLRQTVADLEARVTVLEQQTADRQSPGRQLATAAPEGASFGASGPEAAAALVRAEAVLRRGSSSSLSGPESLPPARSQQSQSQAAQPQAAAVAGQGPERSSAPTNLPGGATLNYLIDLYYEYNFNNPPGGVNDLRAYDVLSNAFSINQAAVVLDLDPDLAAKRRYGARLDLQFGQATESLQGNPADEPRPEVYRNIFQAYGTYVFPVGSGLSVDVGKWASSLGVEGNYTKDQMNYTRSFFFAFLPDYHSGVRTQYRVNSKLDLNYWVVNGINQTEPTNQYKDEMFGYVLQPSKSLTWTFNYYLGQDHPNVTAAANCTVPVQPGLCLAPIIPAPNGKVDILDSYATWQVTPRLTLQGEGDYFIEREWANAAPGESSAPSHVDGGGGYMQYQLSPKGDFAVRGEYMSDRDGLFSGTSQALKEGTATYEYKFSDGFDAFLEFRRDWSNRPYFIANPPAGPSTQQPTAALGLVWWYGAKQGVW